MSNEPEPRHIHVIPIEKIITKKNVTVGVKVIGAESQEEVDQVGEAIASATGAEVVERPRSSTSTININYDHPAASKYFKGKKWSASNN